MPDRGRQKDGHTGSSHNASQLLLIGLIRSSALDVPVKSVEFTLVRAKQNRGRNY